jgi:hypothetical protein
MRLPRWRRRRPISKRALLRHVNDEMAQLALAAAPLRLFCECGDSACDAQLVVALEELAAARSFPPAAVVLPPHVHDRDVVYSTNDRFAVVSDRERAVGRGVRQWLRRERAEREQLPPASPSEVD